MSVKVVAAYCLAFDVSAEVSLGSTAVQFIAWFRELYCILGARRLYLACSALYQHYCMFVVVQTAAGSAAGIPHPCALPVDNL